MSTPRHANAVMADLGRSEPLTAPSPTTGASSQARPVGDAVGGELAIKVATVFTAMLGIFGQTWERKYGIDDDEAGTWGRVLEGLSMRQIEGAIRMIRESWESDWPPNPARFRSWAHDAVRPHDLVPPPRRLQAQPARDEVVQDHLAQMRRMLRSGA